MIGLMLIKDEQDMLAETLRNHTRFCNHIFVLDGTIGDGQAESEAICRSFPQVEDYRRDTDVGVRQARDGIRQHLLSRARERYGTGQWYALLHGDEIWASDPRPEIATHADTGLQVQFYHFFPHASQAGAWDMTLSVEARHSWYMLPWTPEARLFQDTGRDFDVDQHSRTLPRGMRTVQTSLVVKSYNYRSPAQAHCRAVSRARHHWQTNHYTHLIHSSDRFFVDSLAQDGMKWSGWSKPGEGLATNLDENPLPEWPE
jgi:hypothetical protein